MTQVLRRTALASAFAATLAFAQGPQGPPPNPAERLQKIAADLKLTGAQKEQIRPILTEQAAKMKELRDDTSMDRRERMQKVRAIQGDGEVKINPILDDEQKKKWEEIRNENRQEMMKRRGGRNPQ